MFFFFICLVLALKNVQRNKQIIYIGQREARVYADMRLVLINLWIALI